MGSVLSSGIDFHFLMETLLNENCPSSHPIWKQINLKIISNSFPFKKYSPDIKLQLYNLKVYRPSNFSELVQFIISSLYYEIRSNPNFDLTLFHFFAVICRFITLLISLSGDPVRNSPWYQKTGSYLEGSSSISQFMIIMCKLLRLNDPPEIILNHSSLFYRSTILETLLAFQNAPFYSNPTFKSNSQVSKHLLNPNSYLQSFDSFSYQPILVHLFSIAPNILKSPTTDGLFYLQCLITFSSSCLYACSSWYHAYRIMDPRPIHLTFMMSFPLILEEITKQNQSVTNYVEIRPISLYAEQIVTLLYCTLQKNAIFLEFLEINSFIPKYIVFLLTLFEYQSNELNFLHTLILLTLSKLTSSLPTLIALNEQFINIYSNFPFYKFDNLLNPDNSFDPSALPLSYLNLIIQSITKRSISNFIDNASITPIISRIILNLSSSGGKLSYQTSCCLFNFLQGFFESRLLVKKGYSDTIDSIFHAIFQFIRFQPIGNTPLIQCALEKKKFLLKIIMLFQKTKENSTYNDTKQGSNKDNPQEANHILIKQSVKKNIVRSPSDEKRRGKINNLFRSSKAKLIEKPSGSIKSWAKTSARIYQVINTVSPAFKIYDETQRTISIQNLLSPILSKYQNLPISPEEYKMTEELESIWYDWFRVMFWQLFPDDCNFLELHFTSFSMLERNELLIKGSVNNEITNHELIQHESNSYESFDRVSINHESINHESINHESINHESINHESISHDSISHDPINTNNNISIKKESTNNESTYNESTNHKAFNIESFITEFSDPLEKEIPHLRPFDNHRLPSSNPLGDEDELSKFLNDE